MANHQWMVCRPQFEYHYTLIWLILNSRIICINIFHIKKQTLNVLISVHLTPDHGLN